MPKMTLKEAQELLNRWEPGVTTFEDFCAEDIDHLLEAARVVERERTFTILHEAAMRTENIQSLDLIEKLQFEILSDNQDNNEGN